MLRLLALCHGIIVEKTKDGLVYNTPSPDEVALANFAKFSGFEYLGVDKNNNMMLSKEDNYGSSEILKFK